MHGWVGEQVDGWRVSRWGVLRSLGKSFSTLFPNPENELSSAQSSQIIVLRWCCLGGGSFSSSLKWALLILLRAFWKDPNTWHSDILWKIPKAVGLFVSSSVQSLIHSYIGSEKKGLTPRAVSSALHLEDCCYKLADETSRHLFWGYTQIGNTEFRC